MKTAKEMYQYCLDNNFGSNTYGRTWGEKHFRVIEDNLMENENAEICFMGLYHNKYGQSLGNFAFAITNKRLILAQKKAFTGEVCQFIKI